MTLQITIKVILHLLPLIPAFLGYPFATAAAGLAVALCYVKVKKLNAQIEEQAFPSKDLLRARAFWQRLTFDWLSRAG